MSPKKTIKKKKTVLRNIQSLIPENIKVNVISPIKIIENTKNKIDNYYTTFKKDREKEKKRLEKKKKIR